MQNRDIAILQKIKIKFKLRSTLNKVLKLIKS